MVIDDGSQVRLRERSTAYYSCRTAWSFLADRRRLDVRSALVRNAPRNRKDQVDLVEGHSQSAPQNPTNVVLTGLPRSGTTLACQLLNKLPDTVALHEPMRRSHVAPDLSEWERCRTIEHFFDEQRLSLLTTGRAASRTIDGMLPENPFGTDRTDNGLRRHVDGKGEVTVAKPLSPHCMLAIKQVSSFAAMVGALAEHFPVYALVRNPLAVLASWSTLDAPLQSGHIGPAEKLDRRLGTQLAALDDVLDRQICLLDWFFARFDRYLPERAIIRYESLIDSGGGALAVIQPAAEKLDEPLASRNANELYDREFVLRAGERLLASDGAFWRFYGKESVELLGAEFEPAR